MHTKLLQSCLTMCNPMNYSPPGSSVHGILKYDYINTRESFKNNHPPPSQYVVIFSSHCLQDYRVNLLCIIQAPLKTLFFIHNSNGYLYVSIWLVYAQLFGQTSV